MTMSRLTNRRINVYVRVELETIVPQKMKEKDWKADGAILRHFFVHTGYSSSFFNVDLFPLFMILQIQKPYYV